MKRSLKIVQGQEGTVLASDILDSLRIVEKTGDSSFKELLACAIDGAPTEYPTQSFRVPSNTQGDKLLIKIPNNRYVFNYTTRQRIIGTFKIKYTSSTSEHMPRNRIAKHTLFEVDSSTITDTSHYRRKGDITLSKGSYMYIAPIHVVRGSEVITISTNYSIRRLFKIEDLPQWYRGLERAYNTVLLNSKGPHPGLGVKVLEEAHHLSRWQAKS
jgi:hypothetical protein